MTLHKLQQLLPIILYINSDLSLMPWTLPVKSITKERISIDESLIGMKNKTQLIQYIPTKHHHTVSGV
jgi:hypothetical protein